MTLLLNGTNGVSDVDGTAATPAIRGTDTNTGIFFPAADTIAFAEGGAEVARFDSSGNLGIGTSSPVSTLGIAKTKTGASAESYDLIRLALNGTRAINDSVAIKFGATGNAINIGEIKCISGANDAFYGTLTFSTRNFNTDALTEAVRIDNRGNLLVGTTVPVLGVSGVSKGIELNTDGYIATKRNTTTFAGNISFNNPNGQVGLISTENSSTSYGTSSDYRLKENIAPMTGALDLVQQLKPVTYNWKVDGSSGQGFIAHELQAIVPECVTGEKDAVDAEGKPQYQGIDTSFLVATLTKAIQELNAKVDAQALEIQALKGVA